VRKLAFIFLTCYCCCFSSAQGQNLGIYDGGLSIDGTFYTESFNSLQGKMFIKAKGQKLNLTSAFIKTFKNLSNSNVCGGYLFYRLYASNSIPTAFNELSCELSLNLNGARPGFQNQLWQNNTTNFNLIKDLDTGSYIFEIYYAADASQLSTTSCNGLPSIFLKNGNNYFKANIIVTTPLNVQFTGFSVKTNNKKVFVDWGIEQVIPDLRYFILEKSKNGVQWQTLDTTHIASINYTYVDDFPFAGVNFYRIRAIGSGKHNYSIDRRIYVGQVENIITIYPDPVYRNLRFRMTAMLKGTYAVDVYNSDGSRISSQKIEHDGNDNYVTIPLPVTLSKGLFWLVLYNKHEFFKRSFVIE
jgi:hypothetical protein